MLTIPRASVLKFNEDGQYGPNPAWGLQNGNAIFRCRCGILYNLTANGWQIASDGTVMPSVHHDDEYCGFHEHVRLDDYHDPLG